MDVELNGLEFQAVRNSKRCQSACGGFFFFLRYKKYYMNVWEASKKDWGLGWGSTVPTGECKSQISV